jgi:hypothetical protein
MRLLGASLALGLILLGATGQQVLADSATYTIDASNSFTGAGSGPWGTATIDVTSSTSVTFSFTAAPGFAIFGLAFNFNGSAGGGSGSITLPASVNPGFSWTTAGHQLDNIGTFTGEHYKGSGMSQSLTSGSFTLSGTGLTLAMFQGVAGPPNNNAPMGAVLGFDEGVIGTGSTGFTGAQTLAPAVPEPSSMAIGSLGALGFVGYGLRRRLKK